MSKFKCECGKVLNTEKGLKIHKATCRDLSQSEPAESSEQLDKKSSEKVMLNRIEAVKAYLNKQEKVSFHIPLEDNEEEGAFEVVQINGYTLQIKKGEMVRIPLSVAKILANSYNVQMNAGKEMLLNRNDKVEEALN
jgi:hypothetical protein